MQRDDALGNAFINAYFGQQGTRFRNIDIRRFTTLPESPRYQGAVIDLMQEYHILLEQFLPERGRDLKESMKDTAALLRQLAYTPTSRNSIDRLLYNICNAFILNPGSWEPSSIKETGRRIGTSFERHAENEQYAAGIENLDPFTEFVVVLNGLRTK